MRITAAAIALPLALAALAACSNEPRRFPLADPLWVERDRNHVPETPEEYYSGMMADVADKTLFRRLSQLFASRCPARPTTSTRWTRCPTAPGSPTASACTP